MPDNVPAHPHPRPRPRPRPHPRPCPHPHPRPCPHQVPAHLKMMYTRSIPLMVETFKVSTHSMTRARTRTRTRTRTSTRTRARARARTLILTLTLTRSTSTSCSRTRRTSTSTGWRPRSLASTEHRRAVLTPLVARANVHVCAVRGSSIIRACATALPTEELKDGRATGFIGAGLSTMGVALRGVMCVCVCVCVCACVSRVYVCGLWMESVPFSRVPECRPPLSHAREIRTHLS